MNTQDTGFWSATRLIQIGLLLHLILLAFSAPATPPGKKPNPPVGEPVVYKKVEGRELKLYLVKPADWKATDRRPAIVFFHGGGWTGGSPSAFDTQAQYLATRGMVCALVEYRLLDSNKTEPPLVCIRDAKSAMRWVRGYARELGIDPKRIAASGGSAGGHLSAFVGLVKGLDDPQDDLAISAQANALVLFNPVFDNGPEDGWGTQRVGARYNEFSPAHNITANAPPTIVLIGDQDKLIPLSVVDRFKTNMTKAGARCDTRIYEGQGHGFFNRDPWLTKTLIEADKFLASLGWLQGPPTLKEP
jgi:acetyl esterase/lipase